MAYGAPLTYNQWINALSNDSISETDCLARVIYAEDTTHTDGEYAVAKEIYNRKHYWNVNLFSNVSPSTWKSILFKPAAYQVATGEEKYCKQAMAPKLNTFWANCVTRAEELVAGGVPSSSLGAQCYHLPSNLTPPSDATSIVTIGGNKFFTR